jgi:hypothetical protein
MLKLVAIPTGQAQQPSFKVNNCGTGKGTLFFSWPWKLKMEILKLFSEKKKERQIYKSVMMFYILLLVKST